MTYNLVKLSELCEIVSSKRVFATSYQSMGVPFFRGKEISQLARGETFSPELFISNETYEDLIQRTGAVGVGDILLTAVGTLGNPYQVESSVLPFYFKDGNVVWLRKFADRIDATYLYYWLGSEYGRRKVLDTAIGSTQAALTITALSDIEIQIPSRAVQSQVVQIISSIDNAVSLNRQISANLEHIAQAIFKSWFIDFDPVKAKMSGERPVGMDDATAALFPNSMEVSELGPIPEGWQVAKVGDVVERQKPGLLYDQKTSSKRGLIPVLDQGRSGVVGYHNDAPGYVATPDSPVVVFANHTCSLRFISFPFSVIQNVFPILGNSLSVYWLYFALQGKQSFDSYKGHWPDLIIKPVVKPTQILTEVFENLTSPLMGLIWSIEKESQFLVQLRDALIPRLISGELQIQEGMQEAS
jgi:type I restriction enzyme S subunit